MTVIHQAKCRFTPLAGSIQVASLLGALLLFGCSSDLSDGLISVTTGHETDAWTVDPAPTSVRVDLIQKSGRSTVTNVSAPATEIAIGTGGPQNAIASFEATAFDANGSPVMKGTTVPLGILGFASAQVSLFMGRVGGFSRPPGELVFPRRHPSLTVLFHGYLLISGGDDNDANLDVYDMVSWLAAPKQKPLPKAPESWATSGVKALLIDHTSATWLDMSTYATSDVDQPVGLDYAEIAGGQTVGDPDTAQYIVGGTRSSGEPTDQVLRIDSDGTLTLLKLVTPRLGAAATVVNGQLLVVGGAATGAGAEVATADGTSFTELPFPADANQGAAIVALDATLAVLAGGRDPKTHESAGFRSMDLSCAEGCEQVAIANADFEFDQPRLFALSDTRLLAVGEEPDGGETHVFTFDLGIVHALNEYALRTPRRGASAYLLPNGQIGVLGGFSIADDTPATSVELFFPTP